MTAVHLSAAQARALRQQLAERGTTIGQATARPAPVRRPRAGPWTHRCHTCGTEVIGETASTRHVDETRHARYELIFTLEEAA